MEHSVEISESVFNSILKAFESDPLEVMRLEHCEELCKKTFYILPCGTRIMEIFNYVSLVTQYYIQDINA